MKVLGRGWQYTTYDLGNGRVLKQYNSHLAGYSEIFSSFLKFGSPWPWKIPGYFEDCKQKALESIQKVLNGTLEPWMMGNPKILNRLDYEQDKLIPLHEELRKVDPTRGKSLVDGFVSFNKILIERSLIDKSFNITKNFGLDAQDRVVLMDLGELFSTRAFIDGQRRKRAWFSSYVVKFIQNPEVRNYYIEEMDKNFKLES